MSNNEMVKWKTGTGNVLDVYTNNIVSKPETETGTTTLSDKYIDIIRSLGADSLVNKRWSTLLSGRNYNFSDLYSPIISNLNGKPTTDTKRSNYDIIINDELNDYELEQAVSLPSEGNEIMDEAYKKLIDRIDLDVRDHKQELRDRDTRLQEEMKERELRYHKDAAERELRYKEDQKAIIEAISNMKTDLRSDFSDFKKDIKEDIGELKVDIATFKQEIKTNISGFDTKLDSTYKHISAITVATIVGVGAVVIAVIALILTMILTAT